MAKEDSFIGSIRSAQKQLVKKDIAKKMFDERFAIEEKPTQTVIKNIDDRSKRAAKLLNSQNFVETVEAKFSMIDNILKTNFDVDDNGQPQKTVKTEDGNEYPGGIQAMEQLYGLFGSAITKIENKADEIDDGSRNGTQGQSYIEFTLNKDAIGASKDMKITIDNNTPSSYLADLLWSVNGMEGSGKDVYTHWNEKEVMNWSGEKNTQFYDWVEEKSTYYQTELDKIGYQKGDENFN